MLPNKNWCAKCGVRTDKTNQVSKIRRLKSAESKSYLRDSKGKTHALTLTP